MPAPIIPPSPNGLPTYQTPLVGSNLTICDGLRGVSMAFNFKTTAGWLVPLNSTVPSNTIDQVAAMYIDASQSTHDISIYFPDTAYSVRVAFGKAQLVPILTKKTLAPPNFYVLLDDNGLTSQTDTVNIIVLNKFVPQFEATSFQDYISYGYGQLFELQPAFTQSTTFCVQADFNAMMSGITIINATQWYISGVQLSMRQVSSGSASLQTLSLLDNLNNLLVSGFLCPSTSASADVLNFWNMEGLNIVSSGAGKLTGIIHTDSSPLASGTFFFNIFGGILIP